LKRIYKKEHSAKRALRSMTASGAQRLRSAPLRGAAKGSSLQPSGLLHEAYKLI